jgi:hypothetical protein
MRQAQVTAKTRDGESLFRRSLYNLNGCDRLNLTSGRSPVPLTTGSGVFGFIAVFSDSSWCSMSWCSMSYNIQPLTLIHRPSRLSRSARGDQSNP